MTAYCFLGLGIVGTSLQLNSFPGHPCKEISTVRKVPDFFRQ
jgi:hypothetical protein